MKVTRVNFQNGDSFDEWTDAIADLGVDHQDRLELTDGERTVHVKPASGELEISLVEENADAG